MSAYQFDFNGAPVQTMMRVSDPLVWVLILIAVKGARKTPHILAKPLVSKPTDPGMLELANKLFRNDHSIDEMMDTLFAVKEPSMGTGLTREIQQGISSMTSGILMPVVREPLPQWFMLILLLPLH